MRTPLVLMLAFGAAAGCSRGGAATAPTPAQAAADSRQNARPLPKSQGVARLPIGTGGNLIAVGVRYDGRVEVSGVVGQTLTLAFPPAAVDEFVASTTRMLAARRSAKSTRLTRTMMDEPGGGGALSFSRRGGGKSAVYRFYFSDAFGTGFPITTTASETRAVLHALRTGATASRRLDKLADMPTAPAAPKKAPVRRRSPKVKPQ